MDVLRNLVTQEVARIDTQDLLHPCVEEDEVPVFVLEADAEWRLVHDGSEPFLALLERAHSGYSSG